MPVARKIEDAASNATALWLTAGDWVPNNNKLPMILYRAAIADGVTGNVVATAAHGDEQVVVAGQFDSMHDVGGTEALDDERGLAIDHGVPDLAGLVIGGIARL